MGKLIWIIVMVCLIGVVTADIMGLIKPNVVTDITPEEKEVMKQKFDATGYKIIKCWWIEECYFCELEIGTMKTKRAITCNFEADRRVYNNDREIIGLLTMQELVDKDVVQIVKSNTMEKVEEADSEHLDGIIKPWDKKK